MDTNENVDDCLRDLLNRLEVGLQMQIIPEGRESEAGSHTVQLRGWDDFSYIVATLPKHDSNKLPLRSGQVVTVRLLVHGTAFGFRTRITELRRRPIELMLLKFPTQVAEKEIRAHKRFQVFIVAELTIHPEGDATAKRTASGRMSDLGLGGCCVVGNDEIEVGTKVQISFSLPNGEAVKGIMADVKNRRTLGGQNHYGMQFTTDSSPESLRKIEQFFESDIATPA